MRNLRFPIIALVFILALGVVTWGSGIWHRRAVASPLQAATEALAGVERASVSRSGGFTDLEVALGSDARLIDVYPSLQQAVERFTQPEKVHIVLEDNRNESLTAAYHAVRVIIEEGIATGRFSTMVDSVRERAGRLGVQSSEFYVDSKYVYIQLYDGGHYLYDVVPRHGTGIRTLQKGE